MLPDLPVVILNLFDNLLIFFSVPLAQRPRPVTLVYGITLISKIRLLPVSLPGSLGKNGLIGGSETECPGQCRPAFRFIGSALFISNGPVIPCRNALA